MNKFELVRDTLVSRRPGGDLTLLDVGCRGCELKEYVKDLVQYTGLDLYQNPQGTVDLVLDAEDRLPIGNESYDYVVALDVVEHLNDFQKALQELLRVTRRSLFVILPNLAHVLFRKEFLLRGRLSGKYDLRYGMGRDRHRWLTVLPQMDEYMRSFAEAQQVPMEIWWFNDSRKKRIFAKCARLVGLSPSWWVWASLYVLTKRQ